MKVLDIKKERIESLLTDNHCLMSIIAKLKRELVQSKAEKKSMVKNIRMLNSGTESLEYILSKGKSSGDHHGLGFIKSKE